ncbi:hypothetical protein DIPPA_54430, partial [Diplonema papillatum]
MLYGCFSCRLLAGAVELHALPRSVRPHFQAVVDAFLADCPHLSDRPPMFCIACVETIALRSDACSACNTSRVPKRPLQAALKKDAEGVKEVSKRDLREERLHRVACAAVDSPPHPPKKRRAYPAEALAALWHENHGRNRAVLISFVRKSCGSRPLPAAVADLFPPSKRERKTVMQEVRVFLPVCSSPFICSPPFSRGFDGCLS